MNERIKELLASPELERLNDWVNIGPVQRVALETFAGLIIKECLDSSIAGIAKRFGVEL